MTLVIIGVLLWSLIPGVMAQKRGRSFVKYYLLSLLISPLVTTIIVALLSNISKEPILYTAPPSPNVGGDSYVELCENCGADITNDADKCHICGYAKNISPIDDNQ